MKKSDRRTRPARPEQRLVTIAQASLETGLPIQSIRDLIGGGSLPIVRLGASRRIWIRRYDLDQLIERSTARVGAA